MNDDRWKLIKEIFAGAAGRQGAEREAYLAHACAGDAELRDLVESLLTGERMNPPATDGAAPSPSALTPQGAAPPQLTDAPSITEPHTLSEPRPSGSGQRSNERAAPNSVTPLANEKARAIEQSPLPNGRGSDKGARGSDKGARGSDQPATASGRLTNGMSTLAAAPITEGPGTIIGPYKLLQRVGEGGFGVVFMAEQQQPMRRRVALKIIKLGMDTRRVVARFEAERQALAMMDHPNIARVFDAGATDSGRPYFVMELVRGDPITEYCDRNNLSISERLDLFTQVCNAVQHAHTKGVMHRDIKPSNVLVGRQDGRPLAKIIDFGIAKATDHQLTEKTLFTELKAFIGTPAYMSPEQADGSLDIDMRTDVYSLGVLMYELLTGTTPFDDKQLRQAAYGELQRIIREVEPPKPSTRLSQSLDTLPTVAAHRASEPRKLGLIVRGDLDWIVMKAMEKDRGRRYETANAFAADIKRHLTGEPVVAAPPGVAYRMKKFVRKHKAGTIIAALVCAGVIGMAGATRWALAERSRANQKSAELNDAKTHLEKANSNLELLVAKAERGFTELFVEAMSNVKEGDAESESLSAGMLTGLIKGLGKAAVDSHTNSQGQEITEYHYAIDFDDPGGAGDPQKVMDNFIDSALSAVKQNKSLLAEVQQQRDEARAAKKKVEIAQRLAEHNVNILRLVQVHNEGSIVQDKVWNHFFVGIYSFRLNRFEEAIEALTKARAIEANDADMGKLHVYRFSFSVSEQEEEDMPYEEIIGSVDFPKKLFQNQLCPVELFRTNESGSQVVECL